MVGNDVVDLGDPEAQPESLHPRFDRRVFTARELLLIDGHRDRNQIRWTLWACKESAYKLVKRTDPSARFSPQAFEVEMKNERSARVTHKGNTVRIQVIRSGGAVHAIATGNPSCGERIISAIGTAATDPKAAVRMLARQCIAQELSCELAAVGIASGPDHIPSLLVAGRESTGFISLSHHGRFVAFACCLE